MYATVTPEGDVTFIFFGYDEHGKQNSITFKFCEPVGPIPGSPDEGDDEPIATDSPTEEPTGEPVDMCWSEVLFNGGLGTWEGVSQVECSQCPNSQFLDDFEGLGPTCASALPS